MPDISAVEIPKPLNWQDFQRSSRVLFRCILGCDHIQEFRRDGQTQHGIDLLGHRNGDTARPVGIQCRRIKSALTAAKMRTDVGEARAIKPALTEFIFATTADRDKAMQLAAAALTKELMAYGCDFHVVVMAWQDLQNDIALHPDAQKAFWPILPVPEAPIIAAVKESEQSLSSKIDELALMLATDRLSRSASASIDEYDADLAPEARQESLAIHTRISEIRKLIGRGKTKTALESFTELETQNLQPYAKHRVLANIGAIHFNAGRNDKALEYFRRAVELRPDDPKALNNLAYAELVGDDVNSARARAIAVLEEYPDHAGAASLIIQSHRREDDGKDPFSLVPKATHGAAEVMTAAIVVLRSRNDPSWMELAQKAVKQHPKDRHLSRFAAEAIVEPALADKDVMFGKHLEPAVLEDVKRAAAKLRDLWTGEMQMEDVRREEAVPLANNAAAALRFAGDDKGAAEVLDETLHKVARDPGLVRARALLYMHTDETDKAADLLQSIDDPEATLFLAQLTCAKEPARAKAALKRLKVDALPPELHCVVADVRAEIALAENDKDGFAIALKELEEQPAPFETLVITRARGIERGLVEAKKVGVRSADNKGDGAKAAAVSPIVADIVEQLPTHEKDLTFPARIQLGQFRRAPRRG